VNPKSTFILFLVAAVLASFVYFYEIEGEDERLEADEAQKRVVVGVEPDDVEAIALTTTDGVAVATRRSDGGWQVVEPLEYPADPFALDAMAAAIAQMAGGTPLEDPQALEVYGLDALEREVRFRAGADERALRIGDSTPLQAKTYVTLIDSDTVFTVSSASVRAFAKSFDDLREKKLIDFDREAVEHIAVNWPDGGVVLQRSDSGEPQWHLVQPVAGPADDETVAKLLSTLVFLRADGFVDDPPSDEVAGLTRPMFSVRLTGSAAGEAVEPFEAVLAIGSHSEDGARLARGAQPGLYRLEVDRIGDLPVSVVAFRDKQVARFVVSDAERIEVLFAAEGSSVSLIAERGEGGWNSQPEAFGAGKIDAMVGALADLRAIDIAAESMGEDELAGVGLVPANVVFKVLGAPSGEAEPPVLALVQLGAPRGSEGVLARRAKDGTVYVIGLDESEYLPISYEAFENHFRADDPPPLRARTQPTSPSTRSGRGGGLPLPFERSRKASPSPRAPTSCSTPPKAAWAGRRPRPFKRERTATGPCRARRVESPVAPGRTGTFARRLGGRWAI